MKDWVFWRIFRSVFLSLFALWLLLVGVLTFQNLDAKRDQVEHAMESYEESSLKNCQLVLEGDAAYWEEPAILTWFLSSYYYYVKGAVGVFRLYDTGGSELARTPLTYGSISLAGTGVYDHFLCFDKVLSEEEHLALAERLRANRFYTRFYGTEGGRYEADDHVLVGLRGEVTGVLEGNVVYPQKLVYYYEEGPVVLLDTDSAFFQDKSLTTLAFDAAQLNSPLVWSEDSPKQTLALFRAAEGRIDSLLDGRKPETDRGSVESSRQGYARCGPPADQPELISAYGVAYHTWRLGSSGLEFTYGATFLFLLLLALRVSKRQADTLRRERSLTRAAAHELKTPAAVVRSYAEALREDIAPEKREEYLSVLMDEADRMGALVCNLLELSRMGREGEAVPPGGSGPDRAGRGGGPAPGPAGGGTVHPPRVGFGAGPDRGRTDVLGAGGGQSPLQCPAAHPARRRDPPRSDPAGPDDPPRRGERRRADPARGPGAAL